MSWISNNFQPNGAGLWQQNGFDADTAAFGANSAGTLPGMAGVGDGYQPPWWGASAPGGNGLTGFPASGASAGSTNGMLGQIIGLLQQLVGSIGGGSATGGVTGSVGTPLPYAPLPQGTATFGNATLSSTGDPHLALTGTEQNANGTTVQINDHYDNMASQRDLLSTNDFGDAFRVSTTATAPNASGVTYNATATATMDRGRASVTMGPGGAVSVTSNGNAVNLAAGSSVTLAGGEVVSESSGGAVSIAEQNAGGEALTTTFTYNGSGVDVNATASGGVTLGGSLVRHAVSAAG
jgi:hypothetical protein